MILVRMRDDKTDEVLLRLLDKGEVGHDEIRARQVLAGEGKAEIDHQPFARLDRTVAVKRAIHADLAETAERRENEFVATAHAGRLSKG